MTSLNLKSKLAGIGGRWVAKVEPRSDNASYVRWICSCPLEMSWSRPLEVTLTGWDW